MIRSKGQASLPRAVETSDACFWQAPPERAAPLT